MYKWKGHPLKIMFETNHKHNFYELDVPITRKDVKLTMKAGFMKLIGNQLPRNDLVEVHYEAMRSASAWVQKCGFDKSLALNYNFIPNGLFFILKFYECLFFQFRI